jgi:hypothetical protein
LSCALRLGIACGWNRHSGIGHQHSSRQRSRKIILQRRMAPALKRGKKAILFAAMNGRSSTNIACTNIAWPAVPLFVKFFSARQDLSPQPRAAALQETFRFGCGSAALRQTNPPVENIAGTAGAGHAKSEWFLGQDLSRCTNFRAGYWPKILLTAVFFSPIMRGERPRAASAGKTLETPGKASNPAVCGPPLGPQLPRPHVV